MTTGDSEEGSESKRPTIVHPVSEVFFFARAKAINDYANYEYSLVRIFAHLLGVQIDYASIPFFQINNAHARLIILDKLLKKRHGTTYNIFWGSLGGLLRKLDEDRNHVVHWVTLANVHRTKERGDELTHIVLVPPTYSDIKKETPQVTLEDLNGFMERCEFFTKLMLCFDSVLDAQPGIPDALREICHQPVVYPPPATHPLSQNH